MDLREITGFPNYMVTADGQIYNTKRKKFRGLRPAKTGYMQVDLWNKGRVTWFLIHRLVLETFIGPCPDGMEACHYNGNRQDNRLKNLRWDSRSNNQRDAVRHGTCGGLKIKGSACHQAKLVEEQVVVIFHAHHDGTHTQQELADHFGVSRACIQQIVEKRAWRHLWDD